MRIFARDERAPYGVRVASGIVTLIGWAALFGTSSVWYQWSLESEPVASSFELAPLEAGAERFVMHLEGHPVMLDAQHYLRIEEPGRDLTAPDGGVMDLPVLDGTSSAPTPIAAELVTVPFSESSVQREELRFIPATRCASLPCDIVLVLRVQAGDTPYVRSFVLTAGVTGSDADEPPPGRVTLTRTVAP